MELKEKLVDLFINMIGLSEVDANIYAEIFIENGISIIEKQSKQYAGKAD